VVTEEKWKLPKASHSQPSQYVDASLNTRIIINILQMMRRAGRFRQPRSTTPAPDPKDDERTLESKWHQWIEAESFRR
jgi:hypothetical protein